MKLKRILLTALLAGCMCMLTACSSGGADENVDTGLEPSIFEDSSGNVVINYNLDGSEAPSAPDKKDVIHRPAQEAEFPSDLGISREETEKIIDSCSSSRMYLPGKTADFKKFYTGTVDYNNKKFYSFRFYAEKDKQKVFVGSDIIAACDGSAVYRLDASNTYKTVAMDEAGSDKTAEEMYKGAKITAVDALFSVLEKDKKKLASEEELIDYTYQFNDDLITKKSVDCYGITPMLCYKGSTGFSSAVYAAADDSGRIFVLDNEKHEYVQM